MTNKLYKTLKVTAAAILFSAASTAGAQQINMPAPSPLQKLTQDFALSEIEIEYSRPSAKGRTIYGGLVPYDQIWRTGANASTKITFGEDVTVGGKPLAAGTYALYTKPGKNSWNVMFYSDLKLGGNVANYNTANERLNITVTPKSISNSVETFTIQVANMTTNSADISLQWANTEILIPVVADIDSRIMKDIDIAINNDHRPYYSAARYYYDNDKDLKKALEWIDKAVEQNPKAFWVAHLKANIQYKMKDYKGAIETAEKSMNLAKEAKNNDYVALNEKLISEAKKEM